MDGIDDASNLTGIGNIVEYSGSQDLTSLERLLINDTEDQPDDGHAFRKQLNDISASVGFDLAAAEEDNDSDSEPAAGPNLDTVYRSVPKPQTQQTRITDEQKRQTVLRNAIASDEGLKFSVEKEKEEDDKAILLEQIDTLLEGLRDDSIDVSRIPHVDSSSSIEDIENVHKTLRLKNDRNRYCSFAEECILAGSGGLEWAFDGKKSYFGRRPNVDGWSSTVQVKLRRMRYDTSTFVSGVMQDYNLSHGTRIMLELLPSLFLYSKMKRSQETDNLITSDELNRAMDKIRDVTES
jgi:hypothetical protein